MDCQYHIKLIMQEASYFYRVEDIATVLTTSNKTPIGARKTIHTLPKIYGLPCTIACMKRLP
jgi:hypothetical protein